MSSPNEWRALFESVLDGIVITDESGAFVDANPAACGIFGRTREQILGRRSEDFAAAGSDSTELRRQLEKLGQLAGQFRLLRPDGSARWLEFQATSGFTPGRHLAVFRDVTDRVESDQAIGRLATLVEASEDAIVGLDLEGLITDWNRGAERLYGYAARDVIGRSVAMLAPVERQDEMLGIIFRIREGKPIKQLETVRRRKDGGVIDVSVTVSPIKDKTGILVGAVSIGRDISQRKLLEQQLLQAQKMEGIGLLAGGVAHDFNNLLNVVVGRSELLLGNLPEDARERSHLLEIRKAAERATALTRQLLAFGRKQAFAPAVLDLNAIVRGFEGMLRRLVREDIELVSELDVDVLRIEADPNQIEQVIMNLVINARDAMPGGGVLTITTGNTLITEAEALTLPEVQAGSYAVLRIRDTGEGMDEATRARIFEPFFTTKEIGKGTGLGLATVYGIVKQSGGHIVVESQIHRGTTMTIYWPSTSVAPTEASSAAAAEPFDASGTETVLLVEDQAELREIIGLTLESAGYTVISAATPQEALETARAHRGPVDLLLSDVVMPQMNGPKLAAHMKGLRPGVKVLFMSGYAGNAIEEYGVPADSTALLEKPFSSTSLTRMVRQVLGPPADAAKGSTREIHD